MPEPFSVKVPVSVGAVVWQYTPGTRVWPPRFRPVLLFVAGHTWPAPLVYASPASVWAIPATESPLCCGPDTPGGKPVTALPGATPSRPVIQLGPVFVTVVPASTAKFPADASPGSVAASADAGQISRTRAARPTEMRERRILITP